MTVITKPDRVLFIGSKQLGLRILQKMFALSPETLVGVLTLDDRTDSRSVFDEFSEFCRQSELKLLMAANRKHAEQVIAQMQPDLCIVVGWYWLIGGETLASVPFGFIGIHNSTLPRFRGGSPLVWQMINGEPRAGFSLFTFTAGMDDGPIWAQGSVAIESGDHIADVLGKLEREAIAVFGSKYPCILDGSARPAAQQRGHESYCAQRFPDDGSIDWCTPAAEVYNFIRAQSEPYPGAFTYFEGKKLIVQRAIVFDRPYFGSPGQIARITTEGVHVICGGGTAITLLEVEFDGSRGKAVDFVKSIKSRMGASESTNRPCGNASSK